MKASQGFEKENSQIEEKKSSDKFFPYFQDKFKRLLRTFHFTKFVIFHFLIQDMTLEKKSDVNLIVSEEYGLNHSIFLF